jgi:hypothetical protein
MYLKSENFKYYASDSADPNPTFTNYFRLLIDLSYSNTMFNFSIFCSPDIASSTLSGKVNFYLYYDNGEKDKFKDTQIGLNQCAKLLITLEIKP